MPYILWDITYLLVLAAVLFSLIASLRVRSVFRRYSEVRPAGGMTGAEAARRVLAANGLNLPVEPVAGNLTDHFDPKRGVIRLSESVYDVCSAAAVGVAAHEAGHAVQHAEGYFPLKLRNAIIPATNIGSRLSTPLVLAGLLLSSVGRELILVAYVGVGLFALSLLFQLLTLPTEFNASRRALAAIDAGGLLSDEERRAAKKTLSAAAMTYVAATAVAFTQLLRLLMIVLRSDRRR